MSEKVGIIFNRETKNAKELADKISFIFSQKKIKFTVFTTDRFVSDITFALVIGGDGTILRTARYYCEYDIPVIGVNLGRLGFLSQVSPNELDLIADSILNHNYSIQERLMICEETTKINALNDIIIKSEFAGRTSKFKLFINNKFLCEYLADGIIVSTPTGSSAYNLSAGGPVLTPTTEALIITAISPHTLSARPLVVNSNETISISVCDSGKLFNVIADGQITKKIGYNEITTIKKYNQTAKLAIINKDNNDFYSILRDKLNWGVAPSC